MNQPTILVTGGAGVMGSRLARDLATRKEGRPDCRVRVLALPDDPLTSRLDGLDIEVFHGDICDPGSLETALEGVDIIYHLAAILLSTDPSRFDAINVEGTRNMVDAGIRRGCRQFIFVSSISVTYPVTTPYSLSKAEGERIVKGQDQMDWTIVRPCLAYNEEGGEEFNQFWNSLLKYPVAPMIGGGETLKKPVHVNDLMEGLSAIAGNKDAIGKTYNLCGCEEISIRDMAAIMLSYRGGKRPFVAVPLWLCKALAWVMQRTMKEPPLTWNAIAGASQDAKPSCAEAEVDLDFHPMSFHDGMALSYGPANDRL